MINKKQDKQPTDQSVLKEGSRMRYNQKYLNDVLKAQIGLKEKELKRVLNNKSYDHLLKDLKSRILKVEIRQLKKQIRKDQQ